MILLSGAALVLPDRIQSPGTLALDEDRIVDVMAGTRPPSPGVRHLDLTGNYIVPGFIDVHVHGIEGTDTLDGPGALAAIASRLPRYGVTAFCPTTVACPPEALRQLLTEVTNMRAQPPLEGARVLPAHLESNFISPAFRGAQPERCLRMPPAFRARQPRGEGVPLAPSSPGQSRGEGFDAADILAEIERGPGVGIVTLAPELEGGLELIARLVKRGIRAALGHSGANFEQAKAAISQGARHATHLFNRMPPLGHRDPGLVGAVLSSDAVAAEVICDGVHVHPAMVRLAIAAKHAQRVMAITDGTAGAGLPDGSHARLGGQRIRVAKSAAYLDDGTLAGSVATMDRVFGFLVSHVGISLPDAARLCSTTPASELGLRGFGTIARDAMADLAVLDRHLTVRQTYVAGRVMYSSAV